MAKLAPSVHSYTPSASSDVVTNYVRIVPTGTPPAYSVTFFDVGNTGSFDMSQVLPADSGIDGIFDICLTSVDDAGNESDFAIKVGVPLDQVPPSPPVFV